MSQKPILWAFCLLICSCVGYQQLQAVVGLVVIPDVYVGVFSPERICKFRFLWPSRMNIQAYRMPVLEAFRLGCDSVFDGFQGLCEVHTQRRHD